jgi:small-conductance mechanosensitive channel
MKSRQWLTTVGLFVLVLAAIIGSFLTRDIGTPTSTLKPQTGTEQAPLVDEHPLKTARIMAKLASNSEEQKIADRAVELADHEVDLAFHDALRDAANHAVAPTAETKELNEHAGQAEAQVKADQYHIDQLKKQVAAAHGGQQDSLQEQLDVAQAKEDLIRSGADPGSLIQRQFNEHQSVEHGADDKTAQTAASHAEAVNQGSSFLAQFSVWRGLRGKVKQLQTAQGEAARAAAELSEKHESLDRQVKAAKVSGQSTVGPGGKPSEPFKPGSTQSSTQSANNAVKSLRRLSDDQKNLADFDQRIQDQQELQKTYVSWIALIQSHERAALHGMIQSALWILLILLAVYLTDRAIDGYLAEKGSERTRLHTLRVVIHFAVQAVGLMLILLVILGAPSQMPTILGLAGAGLTVALKDFIVAFFGWFVLMGKNGLRVGDWVEINGVAGEVVEINLLRTVLLETGNWTDTGHPTGRKVAFVNSYAIEGHFFNFTTSGQWLWDELQITVPPDQDPYPLLDAIQKTVAKETEKTAVAAEEEWKNADSNYKVSSVSAAPTVNLRPTSAGVDIHVRYIARAQERSAIRARLNQALVELLHHRDVDKTESVSAAK